MQVSANKVLETEWEGRDWCNSDQGNPEVTVAAFSFRPQGFKPSSSLRCQTDSL